jgi:hypothetical protein
MSITLLNMKGQTTKHEWVYCKQIAYGTMYKCLHCPAIKEVRQYKNGEETLYAESKHSLNPLFEQPPCITRKTQTDGKELH